MADDFAPTMPAKTRVAFDVDGTLIKKTSDGDVPRYDVIEVMLWMSALGHTVFVWSGGGEDYARQWVRKLGLTPFCRVIPKQAHFGIDLAFDDQEAELAKVTVRV